VKPPYSLKEFPLVAEDSIRDAILKHGYSSSNEEFQSWDQLKEFLNRHVVEARRDLGQQIPDSIDDAEIVEVAPSDVLERFLDRVETELIPRRAFDQVENFLLVLLSSPAVTSNAKRSQRAAKLLQQNRVARKEASAPGVPRTVLIANGDKVTTALLLDLLSPDYACETADSAAAAVSCLRDKEIQLLLTDLVAPGMSGIETISYLKDISPNTMIVMIGGTGTAEIAIDALRVGAFDYLAKPLHLPEVAAAIPRALIQYDLIVAKERYEKQLEELVRQKTAYLLTLQALIAALEKRDGETLGHTERLVAYSLRLGQEYGLDRATMKSLEIGSLLHDIGKVCVPEAILRKPAKLTEEEWRKMREHVSYGEELLRGIEPFEGAARVVSQHHEKWDGSGYPLGLRGEEIDVCARIFAVADAFDAITSARIYRAGRSYEEAVRELDEWAGRLFDPKIVVAFHRVPKEDWAEIHRGSLLPKEKQSRLVYFVGAMLESSFEGLDLKSGPS
jgi:response regulator RpfG family c-di-GMP phosphodiesterase